MLTIAEGYERLARRAAVRTGTGAKAGEPATSTVIYRSANGDRWWLTNDPETGRRFVQHEPNPASGGQATETPVEDFLAVDGLSPEFEALRRIIGRSGVA
jgi:hypothetical protein